MRKVGDPSTVDIYEGSLSPADLSKLIRILESKDFRELKPPPEQSHRLVIEDLHLLQITVPRPGGTQDLQYLTRASRRGDEKALRPLLQWWKNLRTHLPPALNNGASNRCQTLSASAK